MGHLYDVTWYRANGRPTQSMDMDTSVIHTEPGLFTRAENTNWDRHVLWFGPNGETMAYEQLPWVLTEREAARIKDAAIRREESRLREERWWNLLEKQSPVGFELPGMPIGIVARCFAQGEECRDGEVMVDVLHEGRRISQGGFRPLADWRQAITEWDRGQEDDVRTHIYRALAKFLP